MKKAQTNNMRFHIHLNLADKYDKAFHFHELANLNQILFKRQPSHTFNLFHDIIKISEQVEYLHRYYSLLSVGGSKEIDLKFKMLLKYYKNHKGMITFQYPTMFVTQTSQIFILRLKRIHNQKRYRFLSKPKPISHSSQSINILQSISRSYSSNDTISQCSSDNSSNFYDASFDTSIFDVYEDKFSETENQPVNFKIQSQCEVDNLICDFNDLDSSYLQKHYQEETLEMQVLSPSSINLDLEKIDERLRTDQRKYETLRQKYLEDHYLKKYGMMENAKQKKGKMKKKAQQLFQRLTTTNYLSPLKLIRSKT